MFKRTPTFGKSSKTVADVLAGFSRIITDLQEVKEANEAARKAAQDEIDAATLRRDTATTEINDATTAIENITNLIGGPVATPYLVKAAA